MHLSPSRNSLSNDACAHAHIQGVSLSKALDVIGAWEKTYSCTSTVCEIVEGVMQAVTSGKLPVYVLERGEGES